MKKGFFIFNYLTPLIIFIGIVILFFFPEPETNFLAYVGTALIFIILVISSMIWKRRREKKEMKNL